MSDDDLFHVRISGTREDYRKLPPARSARRDDVVPRPAPLDLAEWIDTLFERLDRNVGPQSLVQKFALLRDRDQAELLRDASDEQFIAFARHARPVVRKTAQDERMAKQRPGRVGP